MIHSRILARWGYFIATFSCVAFCAFLGMPYLGDFILANSPGVIGLVSIWSLGGVLVFWHFSRLWKEERALIRQTRFSGILQPLVRLYDRSPYASRQSIAAVLEMCRNRASYITLQYLKKALISLGSLLALLDIFQGVHFLSKILSQLSQDTPLGSLKDILGVPHMIQGIEYVYSALGYFLLSGAASVSLNFFILQLTKARNIFFQEVETWITSLFSSMEPAPEGEERGVLQVTVTRWLEGLENLVTLQNAYDQRQQDLNESLVQLGDKTRTLAELMKAQHAVLSKWAEEQLQSRYTLERVGQKIQDLAFGGDETIKAHLSEMSSTCRELLKIVSRHQDSLRSDKTNGKVALSSDAREKSTLRNPSLTL